MELLIFYKVEYCLYYCILFYLLNTFKKKKLNLKYGPFRAANIKIILLDRIKY